MSGECGNAGRGAAVAGHLKVLNFSNVRRTLETHETCRGNATPAPVDIRDGVPGHTRQKRKSAGGDASANPPDLGDVLPLARQNAMVRPARLNLASIQVLNADEGTLPSGAQAPRSPPPEDQSPEDQSPDCPPDKKRSCN